MSAVPPGSGLPSPVELARVLEGLQADLAGTWSTVLADERWTDVAASLERLALPGAVLGLARELGDAESRRLAELLLQRWARIGDARPPPAAAIVGPVPGSDGAQLSVVVAGLEAGWTARWHGPVEPVEASGAVVRLLADARSTVRVSVRVFGRCDREPVLRPATSSGRTILTADAVLPAEPTTAGHEPGGPGAVG